MKAFLSYSLADKDQYLITLLSNKLQEKNYFLQTGINIMDVNIDAYSQQHILTSQLFVGIVSTDGLQRNRVLQEWNLAYTNKIPAVLLIEQGIQINGGDPSAYVRFNRMNPQSAIIQIQQRMSSPARSTDQEGIGWLVAGAALLALLAIFAGGAKK